MPHRGKVNRKGSLREMWPGLFMKFWWLSWDLFSGYPCTSITLVEPCSLSWLFPQLEHILWQGTTKTTQNSITVENFCSTGVGGGQRKRQILLYIKTMTSDWMLLLPSLCSEHFSRNGLWKLFLLVEQIIYLQIKVVIILVLLFTLLQI